MSTSTLVGIPHNHIEAVWPLVETLIAQACQRGGNRYEAEDIKQLLLDRDAQLWVSWRGHIEALAVSEIVRYPTMKACRVFIGIGKDRQHWIGFESLVSAWAKQQGCKRMELFARPGWQRVMKDYEMSHIFLERAL